MAVFKQKEFFWSAALNVFNVGSTALSLKQGNDQMEQSEQQAKAAEEQARKASDDMKKQTKAIQEQTKVYERMTKTNPIAAQQVASMQQVKSKAYSGSIFSDLKQKNYGDTWNLQNMKGAAKEFGSALWKRRKPFISFAAMGTAAAAASYLVNKGIEMDMRRHGIKVPNNKNKELAASNDDNYPQQQYYSERSCMDNYYKQKEFMDLSSIKNTAIAAGKEYGREIKGNALGLGGAFTAAFAAIPALQYLSERKTLIEQAKQSRREERAQRQYSDPVVPPAAPGTTAPKRSVAEQVTHFFRRTGKKFQASPVNYTLDRIAAALGTGGNSGVNKLRRDLEKSSNPIVQKAGNFLKNHKTLALAGSAGIGMSVLGSFMNIGENLIKKPLKAVDKNAFAYEDSKNQEIE